MLGIYAHLLAIVLVMSGTAPLALIRGVGLGVGMFHPSSATIFAWGGIFAEGAASSSESCSSCSRDCW
jgi:hypothetical protein